MVSKDTEITRSVIILSSRREHSPQYCCPESFSFVITGAGILNKVYDESHKNKFRYLKKSISQAFA